MPDSVSDLYDSSLQPQYCVGGVHTHPGGLQPMGPQIAAGSPVIAHMIRVELH